MADDSEDSGEWSPRFNLRKIRQIEEKILEHRGTVGSGGEGDVPGPSQGAPYKKRKSNFVFNPASAFARAMWESMTNQIEAANNYAYAAYAYAAHAHAYAAPLWMADDNLKEGPKEKNQTDQEVREKENGNQKDKEEVGEPPAKRRYRQDPRLAKRN